ncbi:hypothetical protein [Legionella sp. CNM-4043-24]|uniref:hypothetical protein n=1 Tax=Legionella sp. CNM-4043-24 TaxID=3421646 RepID=UPI00403A97B3
MKKSAIIILSMVLLSSCASRYASNGEQLYLGSRNGQQLVVPPPLTSSNISHFYDLPQQNANAVVNIAPPIDKAN